MEMEKMKRGAQVDLAKAGTTIQALQVKAETAVQEQKEAN
jgi:hypothetical protein